MYSFFSLFRRRIWNLRPSSVVLNPVFKNIDYIHRSVKARWIISGDILMGAYIYGDYPDEKTLTIYGSLNQSVEDHIDYTENIVEIQGGNHAQFGNYGPQKGDLPAEISAQEQQSQTVAAIQDFLWGK